MDTSLPAAIETWQELFEAKAAEIYPPSDPSHDLLHVQRVVAAARRLAGEEGADLHVVLPAAWFHDCVAVAKNDPRRKQASRLSADAACDWLRAAEYPAQYLPAIHHAIEAHSFSAGVPAQTLEAQVVQDADRLDALGAIGIARLFTVTGLLGRPYYDGADVLADERAPDDSRFGLDHFQVKLFGLVERLNTAAARREGQERLAFMREFRARFAQEVRGAV
ncbi:MAG: HD domain-containing protein [Planctomycetota bacterium]